MGVIVFFVYAATASPGLTFEHYGTDGGDLIAAARLLGVPHPTGYPTYTLLAHLATLLPLGTVAFRTNLLSALCGALAVVLFCRVVQQVLPAGSQRALLSAAASLALACSPLFWSQAVITEVYSLLALLAALLVWLLVRWRGNPDRAGFWAAGLVLGLGLGNHLTLVFVVPPALALLWRERRLGLQPARLLPALGLFVAGLGIYAYLPLAASGHPAVNWGNPQTWRQFLWVVTARQYQFLVFGLPAASIRARLGAWAASLGGQFGWWGLVLVLAGAYHCWKHDRLLALSGLLWLLLVGVYAFFYDTGDAIVYLTPLLLILALWWAFGAQYVLGLVARLAVSWRPLALASIAALPLLSLGLNWKAADLSHDASGSEYAAAVLDSVSTGSLVIVRRDRPTFALWYAVFAEEERSDVQVVNGPMLAYIWYRKQLRRQYPELLVPEPGATDVTTDDLVRELVRGNLARVPVYATDPKDEWKEGLACIPLAGGDVYRVEATP